MGKLVVLMITAFVDMAGLLMIIPLLPFYATSMGGNAFAVGALVSSFSVAQLLSAPIWGRFSDKYGRRPALLVGLGAAAIAYIIFAFASNLWLLFLARLVQGAGGGTVGVIQAYVADAVEPKDRAKGLGWLSASTNAGVAIGPVLGSLATTVSVHGPGLFAAGLCIVNMIFAARFLGESRDMAEAHRHVQKRGRSRDAIVRVITHSNEPASRLILIYAVAMGAFTGMNAVLALFLAARFAVTAKTIGFFYMYIGTISMVTRAGILGWAVDKFGEPKLSRFGLTLLAIGLFALPFMHPLADPAAVAARFDLPLRLVGILPYVPLAAAVALIPLGTAFTFPCVTALLSRVIPNNERGLYMGVQQSFGGTARVLFPLLTGLLFDRMIELPFLVSGAIIVGTIMLGLGMEAYTALPEKPAPSSAPASG